MLTQSGMDTCCSAYLPPNLPKAVASGAVKMADIDRMLSHTITAGPRGLDHLCCGHAGRAELLLEAAHRLDRPDLLALGRERISWMARRAADRESYALPLEIPENHAEASLFLGLAGIGYTLLRAADPNAVPCLVAWA